MKGTMVEYSNEYGEWTWTIVSTKMKPKEALLQYAKDVGLEYNEQDIEEVQGNLYLKDEARAYEIEIDS